MATVRNLVALCAVAAMLAPCSASAAKGCFGTGEKLFFVANVELSDSAGNKLALARKYTQSCFVFPYHLRDDGLVLQPRGDRSKYYKLPAAEEIERLQSGGLLPKPLPNWEPSFGQMIFEAYFLWIMLAIIAGLIAYFIYKGRHEKIAA